MIKILKVAFVGVSSVFLLSGGFVPNVYTEELATEEYGIEEKEYYYDEEEFRETHIDMSVGQEEDLVNGEYLCFEGYKIFYTEGESMADLHMRVRGDIEFDKITVFFDNSFHRYRMLEIGEGLCDVVFSIPVYEDVAVLYFVKDIAYGIAIEFTDDYMISVDNYKEI